MVKKIINKVMETVPQLVGQITDVINSLLKKGKGDKKDSAPRRPAVRPRPASSSSSTGSASNAAQSRSASSAPATTAAPKKKAAAPKKKAASATKSSAQPSSTRSAKPAEKSISISNAALEEMTYKELYSVSQELDVTGRKGMRKAELLKAIQKENKG